MSKLSLKRRSPPEGEPELPVHGLEGDFCQKAEAKVSGGEQGVVLGGRAPRPASPKADGTASKKRKSQGGGGQPALQEKQPPPTEGARGGRRATAPKASLRELSDSDEDSDGSGKENPAAAQRSAKPPTKGKAGSAWSLAPLAALEVVACSRLPLLSSPCSRGGVWQRLRL